MKPKAEQVWTSTWIDDHNVNVTINYSDDFTKFTGRDKNSNLTFEQIWKTNHFIKDFKFNLYETMKLRMSKHNEA